jgi:hypothetical protein
VKYIDSEGSRLTIIRFYFVGVAFCFTSCMGYVALNTKMMDGEECGRKHLVGCFFEALSQHLS